MAPAIKKMEQQDQRKYFRNLLLHFRPSAVPERTLRLSLTWGLGGMAVVLVFLLFFSGLLLKFIYVPVPEQAYESITYLQTEVPFGRLLRNLHRWSGNTLILLTFLHFLRVFYTGAFDGPRRLNWVFGLFLFAAVVLSNFTGYLLPWDQIAYWAVTISTSMLDYVPFAGASLKKLVLGGSDPGPATIMNFYAIHTAILPALLLFVLPFHFWRIRKANGLVIPRSPGETLKEPVAEVDTMPHLIVREVTTALILLAVILVISMFYNAPLAEQANPGLSPNPTKAPWYFMGIQEMLMHFHPLYSVLVLPSLLLLGVFLVPWISNPAETAGVWFRSRKGRTMTAISAMAAMFTTVAAILFDEFRTTANPAAVPDSVSSGLFPFALVCGFCATFYFVMKKAFASSRCETVQALFTLLVTAFVVLTVVGIWFRGSGMQLVWTG